MSSLFLISGPVGVVASLLFLLYLSGGREPDGSIISSPADLCCFFAFLLLAFSSSLTDPAAHETLLSHISSSLAPEQAELCEGSLPVEECYKTLVGMARRRAPGSDGLLEFYQILECECSFWLSFSAEVSFLLSSRRGID